MKSFHFEYEGEEFSPENVTALENALQDFVETDVTLAVEFLFADEEEIRRLNRETRGVDKTTDVLSYPALDAIKGQAVRKQDHPFEIDEEGRLLLGSVAVCCNRAREQAEEYGHSYQRELHYLLVHGILHCLGYDHTTDEERAEMREKEEEILSRLGVTRD